MATENISNMDGWFKKRYGSKPIVAPPEHFKLLKYFPKLAGLSPVGEEYVVPVTMQDPAGFTYAGANADAFALNQAAPGKTVRAKLTANQIVLKDAIAWESQSISKEGIDSAYGVVTDLAIRRMRKRFMHRLECELLYGQTALATVNSAVVGAAGSITMTQGNWSPGIWIASEGQLVDVYSSGNVLRGSFAVTGVDPGTYKLYGAIPAGTVATDSLFWAGTKGNQMIGIYTALATAGTLWNISNVASTGGYSLWAGNTFDVSTNGSVLTWDNSVQKGTELATNKGAEGVMYLLVNPSSWRGLMNDEAGLRRADSSYNPKKAVQGYEDIEFHGQNGIIKVMAYPMLKNKDALLLSADTWMRIGSQDVTFKPPGTDEGAPWIQQMQSNAGFQITMYTNQTIFCTAPGQNTVFQNITPA